MRTILPIFLILAVVCFALGCGKSGEQETTHDHGPAPAGLEEGALYDEVMKLHDEGMEKMDEMYALKQELMKKIEATPDLLQEKQAELESKISQLDSASRAMMVWMRNFHPENDTLDTQGYRNYLESELEKVKKVRDDIFAAVERAKKE